MSKLVEYLPSAAFYVLALAAQVSGYTSPTIALVLAGIATGMLLVPACLHGNRWHKARKSGGRLGLDSWYFIAPCLALAILGVAGASYGFGLRSTKTNTTEITEEVLKKEPAAQVGFVKNQNVAMQFTQNPDQQPAIQYWAQFSHTGQQRLRFFLERMRLDGLSQSFNSEKIALGEYRDYIEGDNISVALVTRTETPYKTYEFWWGDPKDKNRFQLEGYAARIVVLGDDGKKQHYYFLITTRKVNDILYPEVILASTLGLPERWEAHDAKR